jgi:uncharacterized protein YggE
MLIVAVAVGGAFYLSGKRMEARAQTPASITVTGDSKVSAKPDIAQLSFGVTTGRMSTAKEALDSLSKRMAAIIDAVKKAGVEEKDITTESFYMNPAYDWTDGRQTLRGYEATQSLRVKVRDLDKVGDILSVATNAGANQAGNVDFTIDNPDAVRAQARGEAIADAKAKAKVLAGQLGLSLGRVMNFSEGGGYVPPMVYGRDAMATGIGGGPSMEKAVLPVGEQDVNVQVSITYELQ